MAFWQFALLLLIVNSAIWTHFDAAKLRDNFQLGSGPRGLPPHRWSAMVFLFWPVAFPLYLRERQQASLAEPRSGPPPRFVIGGLDAFAFGIGLVGLGIFAVLLVRGQLVPSVIGLVIAVAGVFGGRRSRATAETERVELGELGFDQQGFALPPSADHDDEDAPPPQDIEKYFANMGRPATTSPAPGPTVAPSPAGRPDPSQPAPGPLPAADTPPAAAGVPYDPPPGVPYDPPSGGGHPSAPPPIPQPPPVQTAGPRTVDVSAPPAATAPPPPPARTTGPRPDATRQAATGPAVEARSAPPPAKAVRAPVSRGERRAPQPPPRRPAPAAGRPAAGAPAIGGYGVAAKARPSIGSRLVLLSIVLTVLGIGGWAGWTWWSNSTSNPPLTGPEITPLEPDRPTANQAAAVDGSPAPPSNRPAESESGPVEDAVIRPWLTSYEELMNPVARALDEIDFGGFDNARCQALRATLTRANKLEPCPDTRIEALVRPAFEPFSDAWDACRSKDEDAWSRNLLDGKSATHDAQALMDRTYGFAGVLELELEGAIGVERSIESISGRYLVNTPGFGFDDNFPEDGLDDGYPDDDFDDGYPDDDFDDSGEGFDDGGTGEIG
ncbi:MAG: hypothetical protein AAGE94_02570 [Acidobacteriota bacterium]